MGEQPSSGAPSWCHTIVISCVLKTVPRGPSCPSRLRRIVDGPAGHSQRSCAAGLYDYSSEHARSSGNRGRDCAPLAAPRSREETAVYGGHHLGLRVLAGLADTS
eukprot:1194982-Prorocentrum_minimum.AAC.1